MKTKLKEITSQIRINFKVFDSNQEKQTEDVVIKIFAVFILKTYFLAHFCKNKMICMICYALWVTNVAAFMSDTVILPNLRFLHFLLEKCLDKHCLHRIIPRTF